MSESKIEIIPGETFFRAYSRLFLNAKVKEAMVAENAKPINSRRSEKVVRKEVFEGCRQHYIEWCASQGKFIKESDPELRKKILLEGTTPDARKITVYSRAGKTKAVINDPTSGSKKTYYLHEKVQRKKPEADPNAPPKDPTAKQMPVWISWRNSPKYAEIKNQVIRENDGKRLQPYQLRKLIDTATGKDAPEYLAFKSEYTAKSVDKVPTP